MDDDSKLLQIFFPYAFERQRVATATNMRFVHYSSAESAVKMITQREVWMRNALCMNDFREIDYGVRCLGYALFHTGQRLEGILNGMFPGLGEELVARFRAQQSTLENAYLTCLSEHRPTEDILGRLSMWRAYGGVTGVALVLNATPFLTESHALRADASPVGYFTEAEFHAKFVNVVNRIDAEQAFLRGIGREAVRERLLNVFLYAVTCTKHPGFCEEVEWRVIHLPVKDPSRHVRKSIETIRGVPQPVYKSPLCNIPGATPAERLDGIEIPQLVERVIIGPTQYPMVIRDAFVSKLEEAGVTDASQRVVVSDIPLRQ